MTKKPSRGGKRARRRFLKQSRHRDRADSCRPHVGSTATGSRRLHALRRAGQHADANRVRRRQSECAAVLSRRSAGADEDRLGEPFVGRGGQLLNKIIEACRMKREDVYILNMIKCRPPGNRNPLPDELANCRGYLGASARSDPAGIHLLPGRRGGAELAGHDGVDRQAPRQDPSVIAARKSCARIIRRFCCAARRSRKRPGRI